ncbi:3-oxoacyl-[acyl-carrier-protein] synthase III C-terminal domain-containing protein [Rhodococcus sp. AQ5-07]|uniref:3-oxoacyl-[acyl-carrier-protein] synthase III C-terminal domain-containing protein n=1 Tax=Rhodococcus sp. AQ5-07 TaxID=2054902 RepID=UPI0013B3E141|nr:3-oxoacyl-[acyl-carrier-protein] synthase III C-terminal domain-containing protein [Rhodococcus sp. AQ5-07]
MPEILPSTETLDRLTRGGLANIRQSDLAAWQLAVDSARLTLDSSATADVDLVVYATDTFWGNDEHELDAGRFLQAAGLERTPLIGVGLAGCANFAVAMRTAVACLRDGDATTALVATADVCQPGQRLLDSGIGVLSDGAATCVVTTRRPEHGLQFLGITMAVEAGLHALRSASEPMAIGMAMAMATSRGVQRAVTALYEKTGLSPGDFSYLVTNNYVESSLKVFANAAGLPFDRTYRGTVAGYGHCFAADALINFATMTSERILEPGDRVLAIVAGYNSWACMAFSVV